MKNLRFLVADNYAKDWAGRVLALGEDGGKFEVLSPIDGAPMTVIASDGGGWDHVSVSRRTRCPNWPEMAHVKAIFFYDEEAVMQLHVPASAAVNNHAYCLHLWKPQDVDLPLPPAWMVGVKALGTLFGQPEKG